MRQSTFNGSANMSIGYILNIFPDLTMTFVYREVMALRVAGVDIKAFSTWKPNADQLSQDSKDLLDDVFYIFPLHWLNFFISHVMFLTTQPLIYFKTLWFCIANDYKTFRNRMRSMIHFCVAVYLAKEIQKRNIKHLHAHFAENATTLALIIARLIGISFSFTAHAKDIFVNPILLSHKIDEAKFVITISDYNKRYLQAYANTLDPTPKIHTVHCGIDVQKFSLTHDKPLNDEPVILSVGRLVEKKGYVYLIKACKRLVERGYNFRCVIVGSGPQETCLKHMVLESHLSDHVIFTGAVFQEDLEDIFVKSDIFVLPCIVAKNKDMDGIPVSLMEAMSMQIPTISTSISGIPELIENLKTGLIIPPENEEALASAICKLIEDKELRDKIGKASRIKIVESFEITKNANELYNIFNMYNVDKF
jgi:glycosyltransferase involved in cell wall biosynthesis